MIEEGHASLPSVNHQVSSTIKFVTHFGKHISAFQEFLISTASRFLHRLFELTSSALLLLRAIDLSTDFTNTSRRQSINYQHLSDQHTHHTRTHARTLPDTHSHTHIPPTPAGQVRTLVLLMSLLLSFRSLSSAAGEDEDEVMLMVDDLSNVLNIYEFRRR